MTDQQRDRLATIGQAFLGKVAQRLTTLKPEDLSPADLARWTDVAAKLVQAGTQPAPYNRHDRVISQRARTVILDEAEGPEFHIEEPV